MSQHDPFQMPKPCLDENTKVTIRNVDLEAIKAERDRYREALENIIQHQKTIAPKIYELTMPYCIALKGLDPSA